MEAASKLLRHRGVRAGVAALAAGGALAGVGVAGAAQDTTISAVGDATEGQWDKRAVTMQTGDTVTFAFPGAGHNVGANNTSEKDPRWTDYSEPNEIDFVRPGPGDFDAAPVGATYDFTFYKSGTYDFICVLHPNMTGTITVTGADQEIPTGTPAPTATPTAPPTTVPTATPTPNPQPNNPQPTPQPDDHTNTPAPSPDEADSTDPRVSAIKVRGQRRTARVRFRLSEDATVTLAVSKRGKQKAIRTVRVQARAGTRTARVRSGKLRKGRYTLRIVARDAMGNVSAAGRANFRIKR